MKHQNRYPPPIASTRARIEPFAEEVASLARHICVLCVFLFDSKQAGYFRLIDNQPASCAEALGQKVRPLP